MNFLNDPNHSSWLTPECLKPYNDEFPVKNYKKSKSLIQAIEETSDPSILDERIAERHRQEAALAEGGETKSKKSRRKSMPSEAAIEKETPVKSSKKRRASEPAPGAESKAKKKRDVDYSDEEEDVRKHGMS
jgi:hypothetical protein